MKPLKTLLINISVGNKQVFVALDKQDSYTETTAALLEQYARIKLYPNGGELFGHSWAKGRKNK